MINRLGEYYFQKNKLEEYAYKGMLIADYDEQLLPGKDKQLKSI